MTLKLRDYQERVVNEARTHVRAGRRRVLIVSPTGSGKTSIGTAIAKGAADNGRRVLWMAHRRELIGQASDRISPECDHGVILSGHKRVVPDAKIQVASVQTLMARKQRPPADVIIWDECHHCAATSYQKIAECYPAATHIGLTATPERSDGAALGDAFDVIVLGPSIKELTAMNYLVPCHVLAPATTGRSLAQEPVDAWVKYAAGKSTIVFAQTIEHSKAVVGEFVARGVTAEHIDGKTPKAEREAAIARFVSGEARVLSNMYVFTEGFDAPRAEVCLLARGAGHASIFLQMIGRVLRPSKETDKDHALLIDLKGVVHEHGMPDEDRRYSLDGEAISSSVDERLPLRQCPDCGAVNAPAPSCARCGFEFPPPALPEVKERELVRILRPNATLDEKQSTFDRLAKVAADRGYKAGWLAHRFRATYGHWPTGYRATTAAEMEEAS